MERSSELFDGLGTFCKEFVWGAPYNPNLLFYSPHQIFYSPNFFPTAPEKPWPLFSTLLFWTCISLKCEALRLQISKRRPITTTPMTGNPMPCASPRTP